METGCASLLLCKCESDTRVQSDIELEVVQRHHLDPFFLGTVVDFRENEVYLRCERGFPAVVSACHEIRLIRLDGDVRCLKSDDRVFRQVTVLPHGFRETLDVSGVLFAIVHRPHIREVVWIDP